MAALAVSGALASSAMAHEERCPPGFVTHGVNGVEGGQEADRNDSGVVCGKFNEQQGVWIVKDDHVH